MPGDGHKNLGVFRCTAALFHNSMIKTDDTVHNDSVICISKGADTDWHDELLPYPHS